MYLQILLQMAFITFLHVPYIATNGSHHVCIYMYMYLHVLLQIVNVLLCTYNVMWYYSIWKCMMKSFSFMSACLIVGWPVSGWGNGCIAQVMKQPTVHVDMSSYFYDYRACRYPPISILYMLASFFLPSLISH